MTIEVRLFAIMAQHAKTGMLSLELPEPATVAAVKRELLHRFPKLPWPEGTMLALNQEFVREDAPLAPGDEVAIIPPVSGG